IPSSLENKACRYASFLPHAIMFGAACGILVLPDASSDKRRNLLPLHSSLTIYIKHTYMAYKPVNKNRIVTAASLFDGHAAAINIMRRVMQSSGAEVIHLGHDRSVEEIVDCAIQEDANAIAITSYQGGHMEFFKYMYDLLNEKNAGHIRLFGGGGGV